MSEQAMGRPSPDEMTPDQMPELPREITILRGAFSSLERRVMEMIEKIEPVVRPKEPTPEALNTTRGDSLPVTSRYAVDLRGLSDDIGLLTSRVEGTLHRIEV